MNDIHDSIRDILRHIGEDPQREGLFETPDRVVASWDTIYGGYRVDVPSLFKTFEQDLGCEEGQPHGMVYLKDIEFYSTCLVGSTFIETPKGRVPINRLADGDWVYSWNEATQRFDLARCQNPRITQRDAKLVRVYTDKDTIICTPNHRFLTYKRGWVEAADLRPGESVVALLRGIVMHGDKPRSHIQYKDGKLVAEHRKIMAAMLGRELRAHEHVHHLDGNPANNDPSNLSILSPGAHSRLHAQEDGRGAREAKRWANMTAQEREAFDASRRAGLAKMMADPDKREAMRKKRSESVKRSWKESRVPNHKVLGVEELNYTEDVWCMDVPGHQNFVANGIVVHNCEHHMLPFFGHAHIAYIPRCKVIGVSKLARILDAFARRLQIQERLAEEVTQALMDHLDPLGAACTIEAQHLCMTARGVQKQHSVMGYSSMRGVFLDDHATRAEFLALSRGAR